MTATVTELATIDALARAHTTGARLRQMLDQVLAEAGMAGHIRLTGYDCFQGIETTAAGHITAPQLKTLFLQEAIRAGALVRGIFYPTAAHTAEHLDLAAEAVRHAAAVCARAATGGAVLPEPVRRAL